ncbi:MAG: chemotaxis protein CheB [Spirosoma sp.]|nr:chemotaxis protein CheB [Spirosoma sp.]
MAENSGLNPKTVVVIGGSTGSIDVLLQLLPALPNPLTFAMVVVIHRKNTSDSALANLLAVRTHVPVQEVEDKDVLTAGTIYLAPADYHLLLEKDGTFTLDYSGKVHYSRPSIDVTFESVADVYGSGVTGILLSGANADGTAGLQAISQAGGTTIVQHPDTAQVAYMPQQAIQNVQIDHILTAPEIIQFLNSSPDVLIR